MLFRYYQSDEDVKKDRELQNFANEISADGKGPDGGLGMVGVWHIENTEGRGGGLKVLALISNNIH